MAGKISELPVATSGVGADEVELLQSGTNKRSTLAVLLAYVRTALGLAPVTLLEGGTGATTAAGACAALGLGTAATQASGAFDTAGAAAAAQAASQPLDSDLTAIASAGIGAGVATQLALAANGTAADAIGFRGLPPHSFSANTTIAASDNGKLLIHPSSDANARTLTIDSNANLALPVGFAFAHYNDSANAVTLAITPDTMVQVVSGTTGSITVPQYGYVFVQKIGSTRWLATPMVS